LTNRYENRNSQYMKLGDWLRTNGMTAVRFAERVGTTPATISRVVNGQVVPRRALMAAIIEATDRQVTAGDLVGIGPAPGERDRGGKA
tara:strand:- start:2580 stop:2843 length:264 start_codon:yes stop_codon:yes gene_type:complete